MACAVPGGPTATVAEAVWAKLSLVMPPVVVVRARATTVPADMSPNPAKYSITARFPAGTVKMGAVQPEVPAAPEQTPFAVNGCIASFTLRTQTGSVTVLFTWTLAPGAKPTVVPEANPTVPVTVLVTEPVTGTGKGAPIVTVWWPPPCALAFREFMRVPTVARIPTAAKTMSLFRSVYIYLPFRCAAERYDCALRDRESIHL